MRNNNVLFLSLFIFLLLLCFSTTSAWAQENENAGQQVEQMEGNGDEQITEEEQESSNEQKAEEEDKGFFSFFGKLKFWGKGELPKEKTDWHMAVREYSDAKVNEYYRYGYVKSEGEWYSTFFIRRFEHINRQYQHTLYIQGVSSKEFDQDGVEILDIDYEVKGNRVTRITNLGFNYEMPIIPSVSREDKRVDEQQALQLATLELEILGFEEVYWLPDDRKDKRDMAETWIVNENESEEN